MDADIICLIMLSYIGTTFIAVAVEVSDITEDEIEQIRMGVINKAAPEILGTFVKNNIDRSSKRIADKGYIQATNQKIPYVARIFVDFKSWIPKIFTGESDCINEYCFKYNGRAYAHWRVIFGTSEKCHSIRTNNS